MAIHADTGVGGEGVVYDGAAIATPSDFSFFTEAGRQGHYTRYGIGCAVMARSSNGGGKVRGDVDTLPHQLGDKEMDMTGGQRHAAVVSKAGTCTVIFSFNVYTYMY